jgi:hypothetical protein
MGVEGKVSPMQTGRERYMKMRRWRGKLLNSMWLNINEITCKKLITCTMITELKRCR